MRAKLCVGTCLAILGSMAIAADESSYKVRRGDTLWDISGRFWNDSKTWPELWSLNPHFHNPHIIAPGDPVFLKRPGPEEFSIRLPLERMAPPAAIGAKVAGEPGSTAAAGRKTGQGLPDRTLYLPKSGVQDFVSSHKVSRLGTVANRRQLKVVYATGEDVEIRLSGQSTLKSGDVVTVFDDSVPVTHPMNRQSGGYYVRVLGYLRVGTISGGSAVGRVIEAYDVVQDGAGVMPYRRIPARLTPHPGKVGIEGVLMQASKEKTLFAMNDVVFLDKGTLHGMEPGVMLDVPIPEEPRSAQGVVDLTRPLARLVVVSVEDKTAVGVIVDSRAAVAAGDRFVAAAFSP